MLVEVINKSLRYGKRRELHQVGAVIDMPDSHANVFLALRRVKLPGIQLPVSEEIPCGPSNRGYDHPALDDLPKPKRSYKRRDMKAE